MLTDVSRIIKYFLFVSFLLTLACFSINADERKINLSIKKVVIDPQYQDNDKYESGKSRYPSFARSGLPENFLIKKVPDIVIYREDIEYITIDNADFVTSSKPVYEIFIRLKPSMSKVMSNYTKSNLGNHISIEIFGEVIAIAKIIGVISDEMVLSTSQDINKIEKSLRQISDNVELN